MGWLLGYDVLKLVGFFLLFKCILVGFKMKENMLVGGWGLVVLLFVLFLGRYFLDFGVEGDDWGCKGDLVGSGKVVSEWWMIKGWVLGWKLRVFGCWWVIWFVKWCGVFFVLDVVIVMFVCFWLVRGR